MIVLADDLLKFSRTAIPQRGSVVLDFEAAESYTVKRRQEVAQFFESEILHLPVETRKSVRLGYWSLFADAKFNELSRKLRIAYEAVACFRSAIDSVASAHGERQKSAGLDMKTLANLNASYIIEESAMCMRITEIEGYTDEYHPSDDLPVMPHLYAGAFADFGLTVQAVTGVQPRRNFSILRAP